MCGIAGKFLHAPDTPAEATLTAMGVTMQYRGPDDEGFFRTTHVGLAHRRLSIRDLSPAGRCPMSNSNGRIQVLLNGEIYNWRELRAELASAGYTFTTQSDAEVVAQGYHAWEEELIPRLRGMFAIAVWDARRMRLLLARDRVGEKPLYFRSTEAGVDFASSIEALALLQTDQSINPAAIACYFAHSYIPATHTVWEGIRVLPPAHMLLISVGQAPELRRYWDFPLSGPSRMGVKDCMQSMEMVIEDSVERCLDADVPVGVFLSGGVDSSLIAAMAARHRPGLHVFSLGYREKDFSELPYARRVAAHLELPHHVVEIGVQDLIACLPHLVMQYGQPFGDASAVPTFLLSRLARQHVKVCLSGDGGDESFGGYWRMQSGVYAHRFATLVPSVLREQLIAHIAPLMGGLGRRLMAMNQLSLAPPGAGYSNAESWHNQLGELAGRMLHAGLIHDRVSCRTGHATTRIEASLVQRLLYDDFQVQLPDAYLTKVDVASMAASLEVRAPLLDQKVIEQAWVLPDRMKLRWGRRKWLLKRIAARRVPPEVVYRPKKGFAMPLVHWWRGALGDYLERLMMDSVAESEGWIRTEPVRRMLLLHRKGENHHTRLWLVLWLELWFRLVVKRCNPKRLKFTVGDA